MEFGEAAGFFKEAGLEVEVFYTEGGAQTIATVASGSVDIAMSNGILGAIGAYVKGGDATPYRIISRGNDRRQRAVLVGQGRQPDQEPEGRRRQDHRVLVAGLVVEPDPADAAQAGRLQGEAGADRRRAGNLHPDHDRPDRHRLVGGAVRAERRQGRQIRIVARASEATELQNQTIRANLANVNSLKTKRETITKFMQVIQKSIDWAYSQPQAIEIFAKNMKMTPEIAKQAVDEFYPKSAMQIGEIATRPFASGRARFQVHPVPQDAEGCRRLVRHRVQAEVIAVALPLYQTSAAASEISRNTPDITEGECRGRRIVAEHIHTASTASPRRA